MNRPSNDVARVDPDPEAALPEQLGRILYVENDDDVRSVAMRLLGRHGYDVRGARSDAEAIDLLSSGPPVDLVICEVLMPGGLQLVLWLQTTKPAVKILISSDWDGQGVPGSVRVVRKPWHIQSMLGAVRDLLDVKGGDTRV